MGHNAGSRIALTAPFTESIDHAGFFIQMSLASMPWWMEWVIDKKYPTWRDVPTHADGRAGTAPAGLRVLEAVLAREFGTDHVAVCHPDQLLDFIGERTRVVAVSTHNPLGTTFAAGVYASIFGSSREPVNALYPRRMFDTIRRCRPRHGFDVILGGSGAWPIEETGSETAFGIDTVVRRRRKRRSRDLFRRALEGEPLSRTLEARHPDDAAPLLVPHARTHVTRDDVLTDVRPDWQRAIAAARTGTPTASARTFRLTAV
jgi:hypothetical protein